MAGPLDIQRPATGLIDLLGLRTQANSPSLMADAVVGQLDLLDLFVLSRRSSTSSITAAAISGNGWAAFNALPAVSIAPGTAWLLYSAMTQYTVPAASTWSGAFCVRRASYNSQRGYTLIDKTTRLLAAAESTFLGAYFERPLILLPGDELGLLTTGFTGTGPTPAVYVDYAVIST